MRAISRCVSISGWSEPRGRPRPGSVTSALLARQADVERDLVEPRSPLIDRGLELFADRVGERADLRSILAGQLADAAEQLAQLAVLAQIGALDAVKLCWVVRFLDGS